MSDPKRESLDVWTLEFVNGNFTFLTFGDVVIIHTNDPEVNTVFVDTLFSRTVEGAPVEMTWEQVEQMRDFLSDRLEKRAEQQRSEPQPR